MKTAIPKDVVERLTKDKFMQVCCISGKTPVQWHHNLIYAHRAVQEWWAILPLHKDVHDIADRKDIKRELNQIMKKRAGAAIKKYMKVLTF